MRQVIQTELDAFKALQEKHRALGAYDTEPDAVFQRVIWQAIEGRDFNPGGLTGWELYSRPGAREASKELTAQAQHVYEVIVQEARPDDVRELKRLAWRCY